MRSRAAFLPSPGDPFLLAYFLSFFKTVWYNEIDCLYIYYNAPVEQSLVQVMRTWCNDPKIKFYYLGRHADHGPAIGAMLDECTEDFILLCEDDGLIFKKGAVNECFELLESDVVDIVGSARGSCALAIVEKAKKIWGTDDHGPNFWPNFFFINKKHLLATDRHFAGKAWHRGEMIKALDMIVDEDVMYSDTFVNTSLQLRAMRLRIQLREQYHLHIDDEADARNRSNVFDGKARWLHVGSLSSGISGFLRDKHLRPLSLRWHDINPRDALPDYCRSEAECMELERRIAFWSMSYVYSCQIGLCALVPEFAEAYRDALERAITHYRLSKERIDKRILHYKGLGL